MKKSVFAIALAISTSLASAQNAPGSLTCGTVPELFKAYLIHHVLHKSLTPEIQKRTVDQYVKLIDPSKTLLLQSDVELVKKELNSLFFSMRFGECGALGKIQALIAQRSKQTEDFVRTTVMAKDYKIDEKTTLVMDPDKRDFAKTEKERQSSQLKWLHFSMWNYATSDTPVEEAKKKLVHRYEVATKKAQEKKGEELLVSFVDAFSGALDPHTSYFSADRMEDFKIDMSLSLEGIGASLSSQEGYTVVEEIIPGGAADRAKVLMPKDKIVAVGQGKDGQFQNVIDMELKDVVKQIRGKKDSVVRLSILRKTGEKTESLDVNIKRDKIALEDQAAKLTWEEREANGQKLKLAVIELPSFYGDPDSGKRSSYQDVRDRLAEAQKGNADGVVLNLARNGGGLLEDAVRISGLFVREGGVVATQNSRKRVEVLNDTDTDTQYAGPLVVLTSRASASASEILAGALRDYKRAVIVGADHTFGKGTVQAVVPLPGDLGAMKVTTGMFFLPGGVSTQHGGVPGDVVLASTLSNDEVGESKLDNALPPQRIGAFLNAKAREAGGPKSWDTLTKDVLQALAANSKSRVSKSQSFKDVAKDIADMKQNEGTVKLADLMKKKDETKAKEKKDEEKKLADRIRDQQKPYIDESLNVLADLVMIKRGARADKITIVRKEPAIEGKPNAAVSN